MNFCYREGCHFVSVNALTWQKLSVLIAIVNFNFGEKKKEKTF